MTLLLIRHGQTAYNIQRRFLGSSDIPLDELGQSQAEALGRFYADRRPQQVYSSPLSRAYQTASVLGEPRPIPDLAEMHMGDLEGLYRHEMDEKYPGLMEGWFNEPLNFRPPNGETMVETQERGWRGLMTVLAQAQGETIAVVSHQLVISGLLCKIHGEPLENFRKFSHVNTGVSTLRWQDGQLSCLSFNDASHLQ